MARRRGRPRKDPFKRKDLPAGAGRYGATPAQQKRRRALVGSEAPAEWAEYPLGVLRARGYLTEDQHDAACRYAWLFRVAIGGEGLSAVNLTGRRFDGPEQRSEAWLALRAREYQAARDLLQACGRRTRCLVEDMSVYQRLPGFCLQQRFHSKSETLALARLQSGLTVLATHFSQSLERAA